MSFVFKEAQGNVSYGLNLDGKIGPEDFTESRRREGHRQSAVSRDRLHRPLPHHAARSITSENLFMRSYDDARIVIELTGVDDLKNDDDR